VTAATTPAPHAVSRDAYRADFERLAASELRNEPEWLSRFRAEGLASFETLGFPTMKDEDWHFTSVAPIADRVFHPASAVSIAREGLSTLGLPELGGQSVVFVNGHFSAELSSLESERVTAGVTIQNLAAVLRDGGRVDSASRSGAMGVGD